MVVHFRGAENLLTHVIMVKIVYLGLGLAVLCGQRLLGPHRELTEVKAAQRLEQKTHADRAELFILCRLILHYTTVGCVDLLS